MTAPRKATAAKATVATAPPSVQQTMGWEKETKATVRYQAQKSGPADAAMLETVYVPKTTLGMLGNPARIKITIEAVPED